MLWLVDDARDVNAQMNGADDAGAVGCSGTLAIEIVEAEIRAAQHEILLEPGA